MGKQLHEIFSAIITKKTTKKTLSVLEVINKHGKITKQTIINKGLSSYGRMCSRAWNKTRIELMRDYGIRDDISKAETTFFAEGVEIYKDTLF